MRFNKILVLLYVYDNKCTILSQVINDKLRDLWNWFYSIFFVFLCHITL